MKKRIKELEEENEFLKKQESSLRTTRNNLLPLYGTEPFWIPDCEDGAVASGSNEIRSKSHKKYKATTNSGHNLLVAEHILNQDFTPDRYCHKMVSNICA